MFYKQTNVRQYLNQKASFDQNVQDLKKQINQKKVNKPYKPGKNKGPSSDQLILYLKCLAEQLLEQIQLCDSYTAKVMNYEEKLSQMSNILKNMQIQNCFQTSLKILYCCNCLQFKKFKKYFTSNQVQSIIHELYQLVNPKPRKTNNFLQTMKRNLNSAQKQLETQRSHNKKMLKTNEEVTSRVLQYQTNKRLIDLILLYRIDQVFMYLQNVYQKGQDHQIKQIFSSKFFQVVNQMISSSLKIKLFYSTTEFNRFQSNVKHLIKNTKQSFFQNQLPKDVVQKPNPNMSNRTIFKQNSFSQMKRNSKYMALGEQNSDSHGSLYKNATKHSSHQKKISILPRQSVNSAKGLLKRRSGIRGMDKQSTKRISTRWNNFQGDPFGSSLRTKQKNINRSSNFNVFRKLSSNHESNLSQDNLSENIQSDEDQNISSQQASKSKFQSEYRIFHKFQNEFKNFYIHWKDRNRMTLQIQKNNHKEDQDSEKNNTVNFLNQSSYQIQLFITNHARHIYQSVIFSLTKVEGTFKSLKKSSKTFTKYQLQLSPPEQLYSIYMKSLIEEAYTLIKQKNGYKIRTKKQLFPLIKQFKYEERGMQNKIKIEIILTKRLKNTCNFNYSFGIHYCDIVRKINTHFFRKLTFKKKKDTNFRQDSPVKLYIYRRYKNSIQQSIRKMIKNKKQSTFNYFNSHSLSYIQETYCSKFQQLYQINQQKVLSSNIFNDNIYGFQDETEIKNGGNLSKPNNQFTKQQSIIVDLPAQTYNIVCSENNGKMNPSTVFLKQFFKKDKSQHSRFRSTVSSNAVSTKKIKQNSGMIKSKYITVKEGKVYDHLQFMKNLSNFNFNIQQINEKSFQKNNVTSEPRKSKICFQQDKNKTNNQDFQKNVFPMDQIIQKSEQEDAQDGKGTSKSLRKFKTKRVRNNKRSSSIVLINNGMTNQILSNLKSSVRISSQLQKKCKISKSSRNFSSMHSLVNISHKQYQLLFKKKDNRRCFHKKRIIKDEIKYVLCLLTVTNLLQDNQTNKYLQMDIQYGIQQKNITALRKNKIKVLSQDVYSLYNHSKKLDNFILKHVQNKLSIRDKLNQKADTSFSDFVSSKKMIQFTKKLRYEQATIFLISKIRVFQEELNEQVYVQTYLPSYSKYFLYTIPGVVFYQIIQFFLSDFNSDKVLSYSNKKQVNNYKKLLKKQTENKRVSIVSNASPLRKVLSLQTDQKLFLQQIKQMNSLISSSKSKSQTQKTVQNNSSVDWRQLHEKYLKHEQKSRLSQYFTFIVEEGNLFLKINLGVQRYKFQASQILTKRLHYDCYIPKNGKRTNKNKNIIENHIDKLSFAKCQSFPLQKLIVKPSAFQLILIKYPLKNMNKLTNFNYEMIKQIQFKKLYIKCDSTLFHEQHSTQKLINLVLNDSKNSFHLKKVNSKGFSFQKSIIFSTLSMLRNNSAEGLIKRSNNDKKLKEKQFKKTTDNFKQACHEQKLDREHEFIKHKVVSYNNIIQYSKKIQQNYNQVQQRAQKIKNNTIYIPASKYCQQSDQNDNRTNKGIGFSEKHTSNKNMYVKLVISEEDSTNLLQDCKLTKKLQVYSIYNQLLSELSFQTLKLYYPFIQKLGDKPLKKFLMRIVKIQTLVNNRTI